MKIGPIICVVAFLFWLAETWYFGWNAKPISAAEETCDHIARALALMGLIITADQWSTRVNRRIAALEKAVEGDKP